MLIVEIQPKNLGPGFWGFGVLGFWGFKNSLPRINK